MEKILSKGYNGERQSILCSCEGWEPFCFRVCLSYRVRCEKHLSIEVQYIEYCPDSCYYPKAAHYSDYTDKKNKLQLYQSHEKKLLVNLHSLSSKELVKI